MENNTPSPLFTPEEVACFLRVSISHIRKMTSARKIPFTKIGRRVFYHKERIADWLKNDCAREAKRPARLKMEM